MATLLLDTHMVFPYMCMLGWRDGSLAFFCKATSPVGASLMIQVVRNLPTVQRPGFSPGVGKIPWRRKWHPTPLFLPGEFQGQRSLAAAVHGVTKSWDMTERLTLHTPPVLLDLDPTFMMPLNHDYLLKALSPDTVAGGITAATYEYSEEYNSVHSRHIHSVYNRGLWQPTPVFLPGESHGQRSPVGYSPRGGKELDTTEWLHFHFHSRERDWVPLWIHQRLLGTWSQWAGVRGRKRLSGNRLGRGFLLNWTKVALVEGKLRIYISEGWGTW